MKYIRALLILLAATAFAFSIASSAVYTARDAAEREIYIQEQEEARSRGEMTFSGPYCYPDRHPQVLLYISLLTGCILGLLVFAKNPLWSLPFSLAGVLGFVLWYLETQEAIAVAENASVRGLDLYIYRATGFDLAVFVLLSVIGTAQLTVLLRVIRQRFRPDAVP